MTVKYKKYISSESLRNQRNDAINTLTKENNNNVVGWGYIAHDRNQGTFQRNSEKIVGGNNLVRNQSVPEQKDIQLQKKEKTEFMD